MLDRSSEPPLIGAGPLAVQNPPSGALAPYALGPYSTDLLPADAPALLGQLGKILYKQRWKLFHFMAIAMTLAIALQFLFPRLYSATAVLRLDRHSAAGAVGQEASQISSINDMDAIITTDMELAQSDPVLRPVAEKYHLIRADKSLWSNWFGGKLDAETMRRAQAAPVELRGLNVTRPANTYLIRITYRAWRDPQLAANVANGIGQSLIEHVEQSMDQSYRDLSSAIRRDMEQLRSKMDVSSQRLAQYEKELNMVDPEQHSTVLTSRLTQLLAEYTAAQADRLHKQAAFENIANSPTLAATQAMQAGNQRQSLLDEALGRLAAARQQFTAARSYYGENHPEYRKAKQQLDEAEAQVENARVATNDEAAAEYRQALGRELLLKHQVEETKAEVDGLKAHALEYAQLKTEADNDRRMYMDLETRMREADVNRQFNDTTMQFVAPALAPAKAIFPRLSINLPLAFVLALVLGVLGVLVIDALDTTFSDADEVSARMRLEVLSTLPEARRLSAKVDSQTGLLPSVYGRGAEMSARYEEAIRMLRNSIGLAGLQQPLRTVLITSSGAGEGKSTTAAHLAAACAQAGKKVLLIDADLRRPSLDKKFEITKKIGLADILAHRISPVDVIVEVGVPGLFLMPAGPAMLHAADLISSGFAGVLKQVSRNFDLVIVDAPPMLGLSETQELATMVDGVLLVAKADGTSARALGETISALSRCRAKVLGLVMNQVKFSRLKGFGYYDQTRAQSNQESLPEA
jgi:capsular exopolysaccharide synthesis family protein